MTPRGRTGRRPGFTLVELMLVVALMAVLVALSTGAYFRVRASELIRATEATESKLNTLMDKRWKAIRTQATDDLNANTAASQAVLRYADGDRDRARVIMTYFKLVNEFPTTIEEAVSPVILPTGEVVYQPRSVFTSQFGVGASGAGFLEQSAALFYLALTATGNRGETAGLDGTEQQTGEVTVKYSLPNGGGVGTKSMRAYVDSWGKPIIFFRMAMTDEVNAPPYVRATGSLNKDFLDPQARLLTPSAKWTVNPYPSSTLDHFWKHVVLNHLRVSVVVPLEYPNPSRNWVPTVVSAGPNKGWDNFFDADNIVSYRLRREGNKGN